ncbi:ABC transporter ATP-binding protein [Rhizobium straminoryzae]|uniref:ABC transporter ATP-binding protein n=1 Tax=Rhizobium straminoryzae TaxID=1387186 RepID=A0A549TH75_9HYPH|nr:ABC transporter ATP-binding protein [Rhizobium straminoryzae]TRL42292.1 ABC transporter ATP-binding protein [Rhizobium straminoryzae]
MLDILRLSKIYPNGTRALEAFTLSISKGEVVAIIGGSGCGKSTLLRLLAGLEEASEGTVKLRGRRLHKPDPLVNVVFQEPRLFPWLSVADNVGFGLSHLAADKRKTAVAQVLKRLGLSGFEGRWTKELSGGQAQRVALARAIVTMPSVLLLDEPFSALDAMTREDLQSHLVDLWRDFGSTMVLVTHDIEEAIFMADRVVVMRPFPGRILAEVPIDLPRPRDRMSEGFTMMRRHLSERLVQSLGEQRTAEPA